MRICGQCNKEFKGWNDRSANKFCSRPCYWKAKVGTKGSETQKIAIRKYWLGRKRSPENIEKLKLINLGRKRSEATKEKSRIAHLGNKSSFWKDGRTIDRKAYFTHSNRLRRALKRNAEGSFNLTDWQLLKQKYNFICPACKRSEPEIKLTADHIVPLRLGGTNYIANIQPLCGSCNSRKHTRIIQYAI